MPAASTQSWWLESIGRIPLLSPAEEIELGTAIRRWQDHPDPCPPGIRRRGQRARDRFVSANLRLVVAFVSRRCSRLAKACDREDLVQAGNLGLITAAERFDPARGYRFSTYAYWWIRQSISRGLQDSDRMIRLPVHRYDKVMRANAYMNRQLATTGRMPTLAECAAALEVDPQDLQASLQMAQDVFSLDAPAGNNADKSDLIDLVADEASLHQDDDFLIERDLLADVIETLDHDEREMICHYHGIYGYQKLTLGAIGQQHGISRQALSLRLQRAMNKVRQRIRQRCQNQ